MGDNPAVEPSLSRTSFLPPWLEALRPVQWTKNLVVGAGFFFAVADRNQSFARAPALWRTVAAVLLFCAVSGAVYLFNDLHDAAADRNHPTKRLRPVASGRLAVRSATAEGFALGFVAIVAALAMGRSFAAAVCVYAALQVCYTAALKRVPYVDAACIALGFSLRVLAGVCAARVSLSPGILVCSFALAFLLALGKRLGELSESTCSAPAQFRPVLARYGRKGLSTAFIAAAFASFFGYAVWAVLPGTAAKFGTRGLLFSVPFVLAGIWRYTFLVLRRGAGARPETLLFGDSPLLASIVAWLCSCAAAWLAA